MTATRPSFPSLDALRDYALAAMNDHRCAGIAASGIRLDIALAGVPMTVDCDRNDQGAAGEGCTVRWVHH